ncbi:MAG TPA: Asp-tRNA(Asn)/Glu-tRNA(Gln) amidotransferase GatCAB subunit C [Legionella sp.]|nr:Asp-tRNA(Asn)/Glu-tRNA(Gln) amidotransferase GatCAB subunit C [Legionella sp.]
MLHPKDTLTKMAALANLDLNSNNDMKAQLTHDVGVIMDYVEQLRQVNTQGVTPLLHPLDLNQRLRTDTASDESCLTQLAELAPLFENDLYIVPKTLLTEQ